MSSTITTSSTGASNITMVNHFHLTHDSSIVDKLPIKRIYNPKIDKFIHKIKLPNINNDSIEINSNNMINVKIKICGINYLTDFNNNNKNYQVIPGKRIIGKISDFPNLKFLIFPYTNCKNQGLHNKSNCKCDLIYGETIDGGLQDNLNVSINSLIPIPLNLSLHDVCFIFDILIYFFKYIKYLKFERTIILLNDLNKELNDILIVLNHFKISSNKVIIIDKSMINSKYFKKFDIVYCFNQQLFNHAIQYCNSSSTSSIILTNFPTNSTDKHIKIMKLSFNDKQLTIDILLILSKLNKQRDDIELLQQQQHRRPVHFDNDSLIKSTNSSRSFSTNSTTTTTTNNSLRHSQSHYSWIWYDQDINLYNNYYNFNEFESHNDIDDYQNQIINQMNQFLNQKSLKRICYFNRNPQNLLNACII